MLHPAQQADQQLAEDAALITGEVLEEVLLEVGRHAHRLQPFRTALVGQLDDDADPVVLVAVPGDQALAGHPVDAVGHGGRSEAEALRQLSGAQAVGGAGQDEGLEDLPLGVADAERRDLSPVRDVHPAVQSAQRGDDLLDLGVEIAELPLVRGDLFVEARLADGGLLGALGHGGQYGTAHHP